MIHCESLLHALLTPTCDHDQSTLPLIHTPDTSICTPLAKHNQYGSVAHQATQLTWVGTEIRCMQFSASSRTVILRLAKGSYQYISISRPEHHCFRRTYCAVARERLISSSVQRRQVLKTTSLSLLSSWLPFARMSAKSAFQVPGDTWWSLETVAVVTGGRQ